MPKHDKALKRCVAGDTDANGYDRVTPLKRKGEIIMRKASLPMNLQFFAEDTGQAGGSGQVAGQQSGQQSQNSQAGQQSQTIDYTKIQQMLEGTLAAKEDTALKAYFKQQGLSQQEVEQAIATFKQQKAAQQPNVGEMQLQITQAQLEAQKAAVENKAILTAVELGVDAKTIPYLLKMADLNQVVGQDGKINEETLKNAINKVLEDVPALKPAPAQASGFQVGAGGGQQQQTTDEALKAAFGL